MRTEAFALILRKEKKMQTFKSFSEEKAVTLSGGGKTVTLKPGQDVSFKHHETGKMVTGTFKKKKMMGGRQYAHVSMPDNTGMYIPVHHINESVFEEVELDEHKSMDGETLKPGDNVGYKDGHEKYGSIHSISPDGNAKIKIYNSDTGEHEHITKHVKNLWKEEVEQVDEALTRKHGFDKAERTRNFLKPGHWGASPKKYTPKGTPTKAERENELEKAKSDFLAKGGKITVVKAKKMKEDLDSINENAQYKSDLPMMMKDLKAKKKNSSDMRREYGSSWKKLCNHCSDEHGSDYTRQHLMSMAQKHMED